MAAEPLLKVRDLVVEFATENGTVRAVDQVSFDVHPNETLGLVGESGCGKTVTGLALLRLIPSPPGRRVLMSRCWAAVPLRRPSPTRAGPGEKNAGRHTSTLSTRPSRCTLQAWIALQ